MTRVIECKNSNLRVNVKKKAETRDLNPNLSMPPAENNEVTDFLHAKKNLYILQERKPVMNATRILLNFYREIQLNIGNVSI